MKNSRKYFLYATFAVLLPATVIFIFLKNDIAAAATVNKTPALSLTSGLVGWWTFDGVELTSVTSTDKSGNGYNMTRFNASVKGGGAVPTIGRIGQGLKFDGVDDMTSSSPSVYDMGIRRNATFSGWINLQTLPGGQVPALISDWSSSVGMNIRIDSLSGLTFYVYPNNHRITASYTFSLKKWYLLTGVMDGANMYLYVNGTQVGNSTLGEDIGDGTNLKIGTRGDLNGGSYANAIIDDIRVYNRTLSLAEIKKLYETGASKVNKTPALSLTSGLVGWWTFDGAELTSVTSTDKSGTGNNGTRYDGTTKGGGPTPVAGRVGQGLKFDGSNDRVNIGDVELATGNTMSINAWVKTTTLVPAFDTIVAKDYNSHAYALWGDPSGNGKINFYAITYTLAAVSNSTIHDGKWHHLVGTYDGNLASANTKLYVDGVLQTTTANKTGNIPNIADHLVIGALHSGTLTGWYFPGSIDDVRIYNRALSAAEVKKLYETGASKVNKTPALSLTSGLVGWWTFDGAELTSVTSTDKSTGANSLTRYDGATKGGGPTPVVGRVGQALKLDGSNDFLENIYTTGQGILAPTAGGLTVALWVKTTDTGTYRGLIDKYTGSGTGYALDLGPSGVSQGKPRLTIGVQAAIVASVAVNDGKWHSVIATSDNTNGVVYIDGVNKGQGAMTLTGITDTHYFFVGGDNVSTLYLNGSIDDVRIYNRALSAAEVMKLYRMGR